MTLPLKAFSKSIKVRYKVVCHSALCSQIILKLLMRSTQIPCFRKPACSFRKRTSTISFTMLNITFNNILLGPLNRAIPRQLLQLVVFFVLQSSHLFASLWQFLHSIFSIAEHISVLVSISLQNIWRYIICSWCLSSFNLF
jgi:hypothetical protein